MTKLSLPSINLPDQQRLWLAWSVHLLTATGALWGFLAMVAAFNQQWQQAFLWLFAAGFVDAVDGTLARRWQVHGLTPGFDGAMLDNIVDYLTYVIVPAVMLHFGGLLPPSLAIPGIGVMVLASAYQFCQIDAKTEDHYFKGFPSYWNAVVFYLFLLNWSTAVNLAIILIFAILVFVPIKYVYPSRMIRFQKETVALTTLWAVAIFVLFFQFPTPSPWLLYASLLYVIYYAAISLYLTAVGKT